MSGDDYLWDKSGEPDADVAKLERALAPLRHVGTFEAVRPRARRSRGLLGVVLMAAAMIGAFVAIGVATTSAPSSPVASAPATGVEVARVEGSPRLGNSLLRDRAALGVGDWIETDATSRARVALGALGVVEIEPGSRVGLAAFGRDQKRLDLQRGSISAEVLAPPRLFVVDTPSAQAVDLGCAYRLEVKDDGSALLRVTTGFVSLEGGGNTALVPAGAECRTKKGHGPGTPRFADAPKDLASLVDRFDASGAVEAAIAALPAARSKDSLTVWHLLLRVPESARAAVFARLKTIAPPSVAVDDARAEALDRKALAAYQEQLEDSW